MLIRAFGFIGAPVATSLCWLLQLWLLCVYLRYSTYWPGWSTFWTGIRCDWASIRTYMALGLPGGAMLAMEAWSFDLTILVVAATLTTVDVDAHVVMLNMAAFTFLTFPLGISIAASIRVGHLLGAGDSHTAKLTAAFALSAGTGFMALCAVAIAASEGKVAWIFSSNEAVLDVIRRNVPYLAAMQIFDGFQGCACGVLRGMGRQMIVFYLNLATLMIVGFCVGTYLVVETDLGVAGSWIGLNAGMASLSVALAVVIFRTNLDTAVSEAEARTEEAAHDNLHGHGVLREDGKGGHQQLEMVDVEGGLEDCH